MADDVGLEDDRDTSLPSSALSPAEYRNFRSLVSELRQPGVDNDVSLYTVRGFLASFNEATDAVARQVIEVVLGEDEGEFVGEGHIYAMIRLIGHWQTDGRIDKSSIFVQARVPERTTSRKSHEQPMPNPPAISTTLNPFRVNSVTSSSEIRTPGVDRGVAAFKRLMFSKSKEGINREESSEGSDGTTLGGLAPAAKLEDGESLRSFQTEHSATGMTFVYTSDEEDDVGSAVKHSPETLRTSPLPLSSSPQPMTSTQTLDRRNLTPLAIPSSPAKPIPPPSRKRGASGSNITNSDERTLKTEDKGPGTRRSLPPAPPAPRRSASSASTSQRNPDKPRREPNTQPPPPRPRAKPSESNDPSRPISESDSVSTSPPPSIKRISLQAPPPPPPPRHSGRKVLPELPSPRRSSDFPERLNAERLDSPRRSSAPETDAQKPDISQQDSELSLELGRLQREVDELVYGLTKKRGG